MVQRVGNGEAFQLPASLENLGAAGGQPLPDPLRRKMESFFNTSFADVRVHIGPQASSIGALAFTHGSNLHFAPGYYNPMTSQGQQLLGHELTHVVQQRAGRVKNPFGRGVAVVHDRTMEAEAERMGRRAAGSSDALQAATPTGLKAAQMRASTPVSAWDRRPAGLRKANSIVQLVKAMGSYVTAKPANLRNDDGTYSVVRKLPTGTRVQVVDPGHRVSNFKAGWKTNEHSWVRTEQGELGWVEDSKLKASSSPVTVPVPTSSPSLLPIEEPARSYEKKVDRLPTVPRTQLPIFIGGQSSMHKLGKYFSPRVAPEVEKMGVGGNVGMDQLKEENFNPDRWKVKPIGGFLCNQKGQKITGSEAWVLSKDKVLYGSQASTESLGIDMMTFKNMKSHELANQLAAYWAGEMEVVDGKVKSINNQSGTFHFESEANVNLLTYLLNHGIITLGDVDERALDIKAWTQTGVDRKGDLKPWEGFIGPREPSKSPTKSPRRSSIKLSLSSSPSGGTMFGMDL
jgi:hypothetical protein